MTKYAALVLCVAGVVPIALCDYTSKVIVRAGPLTETGTALSFKLYKGSDTYWGAVRFAAEGESLSYVDNSFEKFRPSVSDLEYVAFVEDGAGRGFLEISWPGDAEPFRIAEISGQDWAQLLQFVTGWASECTFRRPSGAECGSDVRDADR